MYVYVFVFAFAAQAEHLIEVMLSIGAYYIFLFEGSHHLRTLDGVGTRGSPRCFRCYFYLVCLRLHSVSHLVAACLAHLIRFTSLHEHTIPVRFVEFGEPSIK